MRFFRKIKPEVPLRAGLAGTFIYSGLDLLQNPQNWTWALDTALLGLPEFAKEFVVAAGPERFLQGQGIIELAFAAVLLAWFAPKRLMRAVVALISLEFFAILLLVKIGMPTFRDVGLLGAALSLLLITHRRSY